MTERLFLIDEHQFHRVFPGVHVQGDVEMFLSVQDAVISEFVEPIVGAAQIDTLLAKRADHTTSDKEKRVLDALDRCVGRFCVLKAAPYMDVQMGAGGFTVKSLEGSAPASKARVNALMDQVCEDAQVALSAALKLMLANPDDFTGFHAVGNALWRKLLVNDPLVYAIQTGLRNFGFNTFYSLTGMVDAVEMECIDAVIGTPLLEFLKGKQLAGEVWGAYEPIKTLLQRGVALLTHARAVQELPLVNTMSGIYLDYRDLGQDNPNRRRTLTADEREASARGFANRGNAALRKMVEVLKKSPDSFPLYTDNLPESDYKEPLAYKGTFGAI